MLVCTHVKPKKPLGKFGDLVTDSVYVRVCVCARMRERKREKDSIFT